MWGVEGDLRFGHKKKKPTCCGHSHFLKKSSLALAKNSFTREGKKGGEKDTCLENGQCGTCTGQGNVLTDIIHWGTLTCSGK